jgi:hypothetical protein
MKIPAFVGHRPVLVLQIGNKFLGEGVLLCIQIMNNIKQILIDYTKEG